MYLEPTLAVGFSTPIQLTCGVQAHTGELQRLVFQLHAAMNRMSANNWIPTLGSGQEEAKVREAVKINASGSQFFISTSSEKTQNFPATGLLGSE